MSPRKIKIITGPEKSILVRRRERTTLPAWLEHDIVTSVAGSGPCPASRKIGAVQLQRLKPLRDERTVQRYLSAVESGRADGWHTLVYGLTLAVYSFPLRQGLLHYARETISGLALAATEPGTFIDPACQEMLETILARLPEAVERSIPPCDDALHACHSSQ